MDKYQDVTLVGAKDEGGKTFFKATRSASTCHSDIKYEDLNWQTNTMPLILAYGDSHELNGHGVNRGTVWVNFDKNAQAPPSITDIGMYACMHACV